MDQPNYGSDIIKFICCKKMLHLDHKLTEVYLLSVVVSNGRKRNIEAICHPCISCEMIVMNEIDVNHTEYTFGIGIDVRQTFNEM